MVRCILALVTLLLWAKAGFAQSDPIFTAAGFQQNHDYFSAAPGEFIDSNTGALVLSFTDLVLPGNNGAELRFQRTYNSKTGRWTFGLAGVPIRARFDEIPGTNFTTTMRARAAWTADGAAHYALYPAPECASAGNCRYYQTKEFWLLDVQTGKVYMPDGTIHTYQGERLVESQDPFGNRVTITQEGPKTVVRQYFKSAANAFRKVEWLTQAGDGLPPSMTYENHGTWTYTTAGPPTNVVMRAISPENTAWEYHADTVGLISETPLMITRMITPGGGIIDYEYEDYDTGIIVCDPPVPSDPACTVKTPVVSRRTTSGNLPPGTWLYEYPVFYNAAAPSRIVNPDGSVVEFTYTTEGSASDEWGAPIETQVGTRIVRRNGAAVESETRHYTSVPVSTLPLAQGFNTGSAALASVAIVRDGVTHTTTHEYRTALFGDYHRAYRTVESATSSSFTRTTNRTFFYTGLNLTANGQPRMLGKPGAESVSVANVADPTYAKSWTYDGNGFLRSETVFGRTTTFTPDDDGNVRTATNGNSHTTTYSYDWGVVSRIETPEHTTYRQIDPEGTVHSETRGTRTTVFEYDDLFRITRSTPPGGLPVETSYESDGTAVTVSRGGSWTRATLDGLGRVTGTLNAVGVATSIVYDAMGRKREESHPFCTTSGCAAPVYTDFDYDDVGRVVFKENPDDTYVTMQYGPGTVTIRDENNHPTVQHWAAFGDPGDARLVSVTDATNHDWHYAYNGLGKLVRVLAPDAVERTWQYVGDRLVSESHPESGLTQYTSYDAAGNLKQKIDARNTVFTYDYDGNERLRTATAGGRITSITYEPGTDNRQTASVDGVQTTFSYDQAGRLAFRSDQVPGDEATYVQQFDYDGRDNLEQITYASSRRIRYSYDAANRVTRVRDESQSIDHATDFKYHPSGAVLEYRAGNQLLHTFEIDPGRLWPTRIKAGNLLDLTYGPYDGVGNVGVIADARPNMGQSFFYDELDRLVQASGPYGVALYDYDPRGNRKNNQAATYGYDRERLMQQNERTFLYDNNGNLKSSTAPGATYDYTPDNQLAQSNVGGVVAQYRYDADEWRITKASGGATSVFLRGPNGRLMSENRKLSTRDYIYAGDRLIGMIFNRREGADPVVPEANASAPDPGTGRITVGFRAASQAPLLSATLERASSQGGCSSSAPAGCTFGAVDSEPAPTNTTNWVNSTALSDIPPAGGSFVYRVRVADVEEGIGTSALLDVTVVDDSPNPFSFVDQSGVAVGTVATSNAVPITGIAGSIPVSISSPGSYRVCADAACAANPSFTTGSSTITNGAYLQLRMTSSALFATPVSTTVTVGSGSDAWVVSTASQDTTPAAFSFTNITGAAPNVVIESNALQVTSITGSVAMSIAGTSGQYRVCSAPATACDSWRSTAGVITDGKYVQVQLTSANVSGGARTATLTVGTYSTTWSVTTRVDACIGSPSPGTTCADGSKYAGLSPDGNVKMYAAAADISGNKQFAWPQTYHGVSSSVSGQANTNALAQYGNYHAANACYNLVAHGKTDWYLPAPLEWNAMDPYRNAIGGFGDEDDHYWTSKQDDDPIVGIYHKLGSSFNGYTGEGIAYHVRCVRKD